MYIVGFEFFAGGLYDQTLSEYTKQLRRKNTKKNKETLQTIYTLKKEREIIVYYHNDCDYYFDDDWLSVAVRGTIILSISYTMCVCRTGCCKESRGGT